MAHKNLRFPYLICFLIILAGHLTASLKLEVEGGRPVVDGVYINGNGPYGFSSIPARTST